MNSPAFVIYKPEGLIPPVVNLRDINRSPGDEAKLILSQHRLTGCEGVSGVERVVPEKFEY